MFRKLSYLIILFSIFFPQHFTREKYIRLHISFKFNLNFTRTVSFLTPAVFFSSGISVAWTRISALHSDKTGLSAVLLIDQDHGRPLNSSKLSLNTLTVFIYEILVPLFPKSHNSQFNSELETLSARIS